LKTDAFPAEDGSVLITGYRDEYTIEVYCETNGTFELVVEQNNEEIECVSCDSIASVWEELKQRIYLWRPSPDCCTQDITIGPKVGPSNHLVMAAGHPLLTFAV
jgi:hypothetical protein